MYNLKFLQNNGPGPAQRSDFKKKIMRKLDNILRKATAIF